MLGLVGKGLLVLGLVGKGLLVLGLVSPSRTEFSFVHS